MLSKFRLSLNSSFIGLASALVAVNAYSAVPADPNLKLPQFPLQITEYIEPNVMLLLDTSGSMGTIENGQSRIDIVKDIATDLVNNNENIRFCLAKFRYDQGATILSECGSTVAQINKTLTEIQGLSATGSTPLAEAYYEVTNYFAGKAPKYVNGAGDNSNNDNTIYTALDNGKYISPIQYRCQKNYTIVMTDGKPQLDTYFPDFPTPSSPKKTYSVNPSYGTLKGGDGNYDGKADDDGPDNAYWGVYYYLDDMAKYAWDTDLRKVGIDGALNDLTGASFDDAGNNGTFTKQNLNTFTVGFTLDINMLRAAADYGKGGTGNGDFDGNGIVDQTDADNDHYYTATNKQELNTAFQTALDQIKEENVSTTTATTSSNILSAGFKLYQTHFVNNKWIGQLGSSKVVENAGVQEVVQEWVAPSSFPNDWANRVVYMGINNGKVFKWSKFTSSEKKDWFNTESDPNKNNSEKVVEYLRGKQAKDITEVTFRTREGLMGDVVNSSPVFVGPPKSAEYANTDLKASFATFVTRYNSTTSPRASMIYVGANDGMLHGFDTAGNEKIAFIPSKVIPNLKDLSRPDYSHRFYVDGNIDAANVRAEFQTGTDSWRTVLLGSLRRGGQSIFALDVTDPSIFVNGNSDADDARAGKTFMWEFSDSNLKAPPSGSTKYNVDSDLGYTYSKPQIMRLNDDKFYAVFGNGYNNTEADGSASTTGDAVLYILDIATGAIVKKITTGYGMSKDPSGNSMANGFGDVRGFDGGVRSAQGKADGKIDYVYAGDLFGNLWKFDLTSKTPADWGYVAEKKADNSLNPDRNPLKLFTAKDSTNKAQPITAQVEVHKLNNGEVMIYFGTGKLLEEKDTKAANISTQSFYGIVDKNVEITSRASLLEQSIIYQGYSTFGSGADAITKEVRATTEFKRSASQPGWFMDLHRPVYDNAGTVSYLQEGEQVITGVRLVDNYLYFIANFADQDACLPPVKKNFLMTLSARSGASLDRVVIDTDENGAIDAGDNVTFTGADGKTVTSAVSGRTGFGTQLPVIVKTGEEDSDGAAKSVICDTQTCHKLKSPHKVWSRLSWKEIKTD